MDPAWAAPAACSADTLAVPRTPASSPPSVGRVQIAAPPPAGSSPPRTPLVAPARIVPPASSLRPPLPLHGKWAIAAGFLLRRNRSIRLLREGFSLRRSHSAKADLKDATARAFWVDSSRDFTCQGSAGECLQK